MDILEEDVPVERISSLTKNRCCLNILLLASRVWDSVRIGRTAEDAALHAIGIDEEGNAIHIVIERDHAVYYRGFLLEGHVYLFSNISCIPATYYRPIMRNERLRVNSGTTVRMVENFVGAIKQHYFELQNFTTAATRLNNDSVLTDLIGVITKIEHPSAGFTNMGEGTRSKFYIQDLSGNEFPINLWGDLNLKFRANNLLDSNKTVIVIVCAMAIRNYEDEIYASSMAPSKFYLNLDVPEVAEYLARYEPFNTVPEVLYKKGSARNVNTVVQEFGRSRTVQYLHSGTSNKVKHGVLDYCVADELPNACVNMKSQALPQNSMLNGTKISLAKIGIDDSATGEVIATIESTASADKSSPIVPTPKRDKCGAIFECNATVLRKGGTLKNVVSTEENLLIGRASACKESASDSVETNCTLLDNDGEDDKPLAEIFAEQQSSRHARLARSCITVAKNAAMVRKKGRRCSKSEAKH